MPDWRFRIASELRDMIDDKFLEASIFLDIEPGESPSAIADHRLDLDGVAGNVTLLFEQERATPPEECPITTPRHKRHLVVDAPMTLSPVDITYEQRGVGGGAYLWGCESMETYLQRVDVTVRSVTDRVEMSEDRGDITFPDRAAGAIALDTLVCATTDYTNCRPLNLGDAGLSTGWFAMFELTGERDGVVIEEDWEAPLSFCLKSLREWDTVLVHSGLLESDFLPTGEFICY